MYIENKKKEGKRNEKLAKLNTKNKNFSVKIRMDSFKEYISLKSVLFVITKKKNPKTSLTSRKIRQNCYKQVFVVIKFLLTSLTVCAINVLTTV
jgi:hypothetical protein